MSGYLQHWADNLEDEKAVFCHVRMVRIDIPCDISHVSLLMTHDVFAVLTIEAIFIVYCLYD